MAACHASTIQKLAPSCISATNKALEKGFSCFPNLTILHLEHDPTQTQVDRGLSGAKGLKELELKGMGRVRFLPYCLSEMTQLEVLRLVRMSSLEDPSRSLGRLTGLRSLGIVECDKVVALPESVSRLTNLTRLGTSCSVPDAPESVLSKIEELILWNGRMLEGSTLSFTTWMRGLKRLELQGGWGGTLPRFITLSPTFSSLTLLESLVIGGICGGGIPPILGSLPRLSQLRIRIEHFLCLPPGLAALKSLFLRTTEKPAEVSSDPLPPGSYSSLEELSLVGDIKRLPAAVGQLRALQKFTVREAEAADLPEIRAISTLKTLRIRGKLESFPLSPAWRLDFLDVHNCQGLENLESSGGPVHAKELWVNCIQLANGNDWDSIFEGVQVLQVKCVDNISRHASR